MCIFTVLNFPINAFFTDSVVEVYFRVYFIISIYLYKTCIVAKQEMNKNILRFKKKTFLDLIFIHFI